MITSLDDITSSYGHLPKPQEWRLLAKPVVGQIQGLDRFHGIAVATNGIHVAIARPFDFVVGHLYWFVKDEPTEESDIDDELQKQKPKTVVEAVFQPFLTE
ncbi:MAG TPA: hypothetical protein VIV60_30520 [Polyangiaceae bacterium]